MSLRPTLPVASLLLCAGLLGLSAAPAVAKGMPLSAAPEPSAVPAAAPEEVRGVWVVRTDLTSPGAVSRAVKTARRNGLNTLFVQCRGRGDAFYAGTLEPRASALAKAGPDFDPLAQAVREGHEAGLKVHAWVNSCYVWSDKKAPAAANHLVNTHKDWLAVDRTGRRCCIGDEHVFICPSNAEARAHLAAVCKEIAERYDVDGVQLDYIRYAGSNLCYCAGCLKQFEEYMASRIAPQRLAACKARGRLGLANAFPYNWQQFRRDRITGLVREIRAAVKTARPTACLSAAVIPWGRCPADFKQSEAYRTVGQDWFGWIKAGLVDAVCPMTYQVGLPGFKSWVDGVRRAYPDFPVWYGIGAYLFGPESAAAKVKTVRRAGGKGWVLFSYTAVTKSGTDDAYLRRLKSRVLPERRAASR